MKNKIIISCFVLCVFMCGSYTLYKTTGSHPGSTGAPLDQTCAQSGCHAGAAVIANAVNNNTLIFSGTDSTYLPNQPYTLTVQVKGTSVNPIVKFGFELVAIRDADSTNVGQFTITDPNRTHLINHAVGTDTRYSVTHDAPGTPAVSANFNQWVMTWTAPFFNTGSITFYYATNCTNNDGLDTGDRIYLHSFQIKPNSMVALKEFGDEYQSNAFYNANTKEIRINYNLKTQKQVSIVLCDLAGKELINIPVSLKARGQQTEMIPLSENIKPGVYLVNLKIGNTSVSKKLVVE